MHFEFDKGYFEYKYFISMSLGRAEKSSAAFPSLSKSEPLVSLILSPSLSFSLSPSVSLYIRLAAKNPREEISLSSLLRRKSSLSSLPSRIYEMAHPHSNTSANPAASIHHEMWILDRAIGYSRSFPWPFAYFPFLGFVLDVPVFFSFISLTHFDRIFSFIKFPF